MGGIISFHFIFLSFINLLFLYYHLYFLFYFIRLFLFFFLFLLEHCSEQLYYIICVFIY